MLHQDAVLESIHKSFSDINLIFLTVTHVIFVISEIPRQIPLIIVILLLALYNGWEMDPKSTDWNIAVINAMYG